MHKHPHHRFWFPLKNRLSLHRWLLTSFLLSLLLALNLPPVTAANSAPAELPSLGLASTYDISLNQERLLGQGWLRQFRAQSAIHNDALTQDFTERLIQNLATWNKQLERKELDILLVDQRELNAFAVPGGIVGVNTGLFIYADHEDEFASVMAHELAHISQRHFARRVQAAQDMQWQTLAGLLAGILVASQGHADAGVAAIMGSQALSIQNQLAWSRTYEQEADRIGMETLVAAGYPAAAMPQMFNQMQRLASLGGRPPEFLLTHPLTETRIADAYARADQLNTRQSRVLGKDYQMLRVRLAFHHLQPQDALNLFAPAANQASNLTLPAALVYAQSLNAKAQGDKSTYLANLQRLAQSEPDWLLVQYLYIEALASNNNWELAFNQLDALIASAPGFYPAQLLRADFLQSLNRWEPARSQLHQLSLQRPNDPYIWHLLAEAAGKSGRNMQLHQARAEYFQLTGRFRSALEQLDLALEQARQQQQPWGVQLAIRERRKDLDNLRNQMEL